MTAATFTTRPCQHVYKLSEACEHETDGQTCWCDPITTYIDPVTGGRVITHRTMEA